MLTQTQSVVNFDKNQTAGNKYFVKKTIIYFNNLITPGDISCFFSEVRLCVGHRYQKSITDSSDIGKMYRNKGLPHLQDTYSKWPKGGAVLSVSNETLKKR